MSIFRTDASQEAIRYLQNRATGRVDAGETAAFTRQFENIETTLYRYKYGRIKFRSVIPALSVPAWADKHTYRMLDGVGDADWVGSMGNDFPRVEVKGDETSQPIRRLGDSFEYNYDEVLKAAKSGEDLSAEKAIIARRKIEEKMDYVAAFGDPKVGIPSFVTNSNLAATTKGTQSAGTDWTGAGKPSDILNDISAVIQKIDTTSKFSMGEDVGISLLVGSKNLTFLNSKFMSDTGYFGGTYASFIMQSIPRIREILFWPQLDAAGSGSKERLLAGVRDPSVMGLVIAEDFRLQPPEPRNMAWVVNCTAKFGGTVVRDWTLWTYMDGTQP